MLDNDFPYTSTISYSGRHAKIRLVLEVEGLVSDSVNLTALAAHLGAKLERGLWRLPGNWRLIKKAGRYLNL